MNFSSGTVASGYGYSKTSTRATFPTSSGRSPRPTPGAGARGSAPQLRLSCASARARAQRGLLDGLRGGWGSHRLPMALHAPHPASSVGGALPAEAAVDKSGRLRGGAPRLAPTLLAPFGGPGTRADGRHTRLADPAFSTPFSTPQSGSRGGYAMGPSPRRAPTRCTRRWTLWGICSPCM